MACASKQTAAWPLCIIIEPNLSVFFCWCLLHTGIGADAMSSLLNQIRGSAASSVSAAPVDVSNIRKEGWIMKESAMIRTYRRRWLVLTPDRLYSFKSERQYVNPTEDVDLKLCGTVKSADDLTNRQFTFTVQVPERNFFLMASSDAERNEWVAAIGRATTESRRVRSYSEEVEYQEQQARLAGSADSSGGAGRSEPGNTYAENAFSNVGATTEKRATRFV